MNGHAMRTLSFISGASYFDRCVYGRFWNTVARPLVVCVGHLDLDPFSDIRAAGPSPLIILIKP